MAFALNTVMDQLAAATGVTRAFGYPVGQVTPPCVLVDYPEQVDYDYTFHANATDGVMSATFPVYYLVGDVLDLATRDAISALVSGAGSIKSVLDGAVAAANICNTVNVRPGPITVGGVPYFGVRFDVEVVA